MLIIVMLPSQYHTNYCAKLSKMREQIFLDCRLTHYVLSQSLGVCVCSDSWAGSDCSVPRDSNSLVWETLLDTQLTVVGEEHNTIKQILCNVLFKFLNPNTHKHTLIVHCCSAEPGPQVPPQDGTLSGVWTAGQPLDVWRTLSVRGHSGKCLQVKTFL